jgi:hypothetical protein
MVIHVLKKTHPSKCFYKKRKKEKKEKKKKKKREKNSWGEKRTLCGWSKKESPVLFLSSPTTVHTPSSSPSSTYFGPPPSLNPLNPVSGSGPPKGQRLQGA